MFKRTLEADLQSLARQYPVVTLLGPRQSGKTTLVKRAFPNKIYVNMEDAENRALATADPKSFIDSYPDGAIFDEVQRTPHLLSYIQVRVDESEKKGMFILTGSHQAELHSAVSQSLAGRTSLLRLLPLSLSEIREAKISDSLEEIILKGGYPNPSCHLRSDKRKGKGCHQHHEFKNEALIGHSVNMPGQPTHHFAEGCFDRFPNFLPVAVVNQALSPV